MRMTVAAFALILLASCDARGGGVFADEGEVAESSASFEADEVPPQTGQLPAAAPPPADVPADLPKGMGWDTASSEEGTALRLTSADRRVVVGIACIAQPRRLVVLVPGLAKAAAAENLTLVIDGEPITLVADHAPLGDIGQGDTGIVGEGVIPADFAQRVRSATSVTLGYGAQRIGPLGALPAVQTEQLAVGCGEAAG